MTSPTDDLAQRLREVWETSSMFNSEAWEAVADFVRHLLAEAERKWEPIETIPKDGLLDLWLEGNVRWCDCYYDSICDQWRTSRPSGHLIWVPARAVLFWRYPPSSPSLPKGPQP